MVFGAEQEAVEEMLSATPIVLISPRVSAAWAQVRVQHAGHFYRITVALLL